jgi:CobN/Magnesium Chelatase
MFWRLFLAFLGKNYYPKSISLCCVFALNPHLLAFRDSFANIVDLLDDMFERCANADEPSELNFVKKHSEELKSSGVNERTAARLFSNP